MSAGWRHGNGYLLTVLTLTSAVNWADRQVVPILFPGIRAELGLSDTELGIVGGLAFSLIYAVTGLLFGFAADRYVRVYVIAFGLVVWSVATAAGGLATDFTTLFWARFFTGIGEASLFPCALSLIGERFPAERRGRALGIFGMAAAIGAGLGIGLGGRLADDLGWRTVFFIYGAAGLVLLPLVLSVPEARRAHHDRPTDHPGTIIWALLRDPRLLVLWIGGMTALAPGSATRPGCRPTSCASTASTSPAPARSSVGRHSSAACSAASSAACSPTAADVSASPAKSRSW
jgi:MFS family permease